MISEMNGVRHVYGKVSVFSRSQFMGVLKNNREDRKQPKMMRITKGLGGTLPPSIMGPMAGEPRVTITWGAEVLKHITVTTCPFIIWSYGANMAQVGDGQRFRPHLWWHL